MAAKKAGKTRRRAAGGAGALRFCSRRRRLTIVPILRASMNSVLPFCALLRLMNQRDTGIGVP